MSLPPIKHILFDMDDTLVATHDYIADHLILEDQDLKYQMGLCDVHGHPYTEGGEPLQHEIYDQILKPLRFMIEADPVYWLKYGKDEFLAMLDRLKEAGINLGVCTHRGWTPDGAVMSADWLVNMDIPHLTDMHSINSKDHPCKLEYLSKHYGNEFLLVDDNPFHGKNREKELNYNRNVLQCVSEHEVPNFVHFARFSTLAELRELISERTGVLL